MGRSGSSCRASIFLVNNILKAIYGDFASADFEEGAHKSADHIAQEPVRGNGEDEFVVFAVPMRLRDVADEIVDLRMHFRKTGKILVLKE